MTPDNLTPEQQATLLEAEARIYESHEGQNNYLLARLLLEQAQELRRMAQEQT